MPTILNGLTYAGDLIDILINYALILIVLLPYFLSLRRAPRSHTRRWLLGLAIIAAGQVAVWFAWRAVGVSLVWSGMAGYLAADFLRDRTFTLRRQRRWVTAALILAGAGVYFYAITLPMITTWFHLGGVAAGVLTYFGVRQLLSGSGAQKT